MIATHSIAGLPPFALPCRPRAALLSPKFPCSAVSLRYQQVRPAQGLGSSLACCSRRGEHEGLESEDAPSTSYAVAETSPPPVQAGHVRRIVEKVTKAAAVGCLCFALALNSVNPALAARSGGYMGGSNFSSRSGAGSSLGSSYGGSSFGGSGLGGSYSGLSRGLTGSHTMPLTGQLRRGPSVSMNSFGWFGPPVYYGGGYGYGAPAVGGGGGLGNVLLLGVLAAILWTAFSSYSGSSAVGEIAGGDKVTVAKLQVGLLGSAKSMKRDLERIADRANTSSPSGLHYILQETVLALLRNPDYCVYGTASTRNKRGLEAGEASFNKLSMEERSKFKQETLVNVSGRRKSGQYSGSGGHQGTNELIVVTLLVAAEGGVKLPNVTSLEELRTALSRLGSIGKDQTLAVEVLWTPQAEDDYYTRDDIFQDYPTLNTL